MKDQALKIVKKLRAYGFEAMYAGGYVRDMLLGVESNDIDIATNARPEMVESLFEKTLAVGKAFGVIVVVMDGQEIEVATYRVDGAYTDGRRPDNVVFCNMEEDAKRRDLTINGLFYDPIEDKLFDAVGGIEDLHAKIIRLIGNPDDRITEDKLRMMRVVRFASRLNFEIEPGTMEAVTRHAPEIVQVSAERIADELLKILRTGKYRRSIGLLMSSGLMKHILPEIEVMKGCEQPADYHPEGDVLTHTILALEDLPEDASDELRMGVLFHDVGKPPTQTFEDRIRFSGHDIRGKFMTEEILKRLRFSNEFTDRVVALVENHMKFMHVKEMRTSRLKRFMALPYFGEHMLLHKADCMSSHRNLENLDFMTEKLRTYEPEEIRPPKILTGKDLIDMGFKPGPIFTVIMTDVEDRQLEGIILDPEKARDYVRETYEVSVP